MRNKLTVWLLLFAMIITSVGVLAEESAAPGENIAEVIFQSHVKTKNAKYVWHTPSVGPSFVKKDGRAGWQIQRLNNDDCLSVGIKINDDLMYKLQNQPVEIEIDYFDEGYGQFGIRYSKAPGSESEKPDNTVLTDTGTWKTKTYYLEDAYFGNDFKVMQFPEKVDLVVGTFLDAVVQTAATVTIGAVRVKKVSWRTRIFAAFTEQHGGNNFFPGQGDKLGVSLFNRSAAPETAALRYTVKNDLDETVYSNTETLDFTGNETKQMDLSGEVTAFGTYTLSVESLDGDGNATNEQKLYFSLSDSPKSIRNDFFGVGYHCDRPDVPEITLGLMKESGSGWLRVDLRWGECEISKGVYVIPAELENVIEFAQKNNVKILLILNHGTTLYPNSGLSTDPETLDALSKYAQWVAATLKGRVDHFEFLNEINYRVDAETFFSLQKALYQGVKRGNPNSFFLAFDSIGIDMTMSERVFEMGGLDYMDGYSIHPYQNHATPENPDMDARVEPLKELMRKYGGEKPIWITEIGWITYDHVTQSKTQRQVASYIVRMSALLQGQKTVDKLLWYELQQHGVSLVHQEANFGMLNTWNGCGDPNPYGAKSAFLATNAMNAKIGNADVADYKVFDGNSYAVRYRRRDDGKDVLVLWTANPRAALNLRLGAESGEQYDIFGNKQCDLYSSDGVFSFLLSGEPIYLVGDFSQLEQAQSGILLDKTFTNSIAGDVNRFTLTKTVNEPLTVSVSSLGGVDVAKNDGFLDNTAELQLVLNDSALYIDSTKRASDRESNRVNLKVAGGDKTYLSGQLQCIAKPPVEASFGKCEMYGGTYLNRWQGNVTIKNNSAQQQVGGSFEIVSPAEFAGYIGKIPFDGIAPGESRQIKFNFPEMADKKIVPVKAKITLSNGHVTEIAGNMNFAYATYADTKPVIDGELSVGEWETGIMYANEAKFVTPYPNYINLWKGKSDLSGSYGMRWDEEYCYFFADVTDDVHWQQNLDGNMWIGDSIQMGITDDFGLNMNKTDNPGLEGVGVDFSRFTELTLGLTKEGSVVWRNSSICGKTSMRVPNAEAVIIRKGLHTIYEVKLPWTELLSDGAQVKKDSVLGVSLLLNENDSAGRVGYLEYGAGIGESKDTREFGSIMLIGGKR